MVISDFNYVLLCTNYLIFVLLKVLSLMLRPYFDSLLAMLNEAQWAKK